MAKLLASALSDDFTFSTSSDSFTPTYTDQIERAIITDIQGRSRFPVGGTDFFIDQINIFLPQLRGLRTRWVPGTSRNSIEFRFLEAANLTNELFTLEFPAFETDSTLDTSIQVKVPNNTPEYVIAINTPSAFLYDNVNIQTIYNGVTANLSISVILDTNFDLAVL